MPYSLSAANCTQFRWVEFLLPLSFNYKTHFLMFAFYSFFIRWYMWRICWPVSLKVFLDLLQLWLRNPFRFPWLEFHIYVKNIVQNDFKVKGYLFVRFFCSIFFLLRRLLIKYLLQTLQLKLFKSEIVASFVLNMFFIWISLLSILKPFLAYSRSSFALSRLLVVHPVYRVFVSITSAQNNSYLQLEFAYRYIQQF